MGKDGLGDGVETPLDEASAHRFRSTAARANFLALDRPDLAFATKELCRIMAAPKKSDISALRRVSGIWCQRSTSYTSFCANSNLDVFVATDSARCLATRRSNFWVRSNDGPPPHHALEHDAKRR